jgi:2-methylcitrate dehydratase
VGTTRDIAEFAHETTFDDFDSALVKHVKNVLLSGLGMTLAGVNTGAGKAVINYVKECAAPQEAGVLGAGFRTSAEYAALANGTTSHSTELEDDIMPDLIYSVGIFPGVFALGEKLHVSGKEVIEASIIAWDIAAKLSLPAVKPLLSRGGVIPSFCTIGVAAASAMLAKHGLTGQPDILEIPMGFLQGVAGEAYLIPKLGTPYRAMNIGIKKYPCCFLEMHIIDGFIELIKAHNISADNVESIQVAVPSGFAKTVRFHHPKDEEEARFSLPHSIACCFLDKKPWIESYSTERVNNPEVTAFRDKVKMVVQPEETSSEMILGGESPISIRLKDGTEYRKICPKPTDPVIVSDEEVMDKYIKCASRVLSQSRAEHIAETVLSLEKVQDISELMTLLTFPDK